MFFLSPPTWLNIKSIKSADLKTTAAVIFTTFHWTFLHLNVFTQQAYLAWWIYLFHTVAIGTPERQSAKFHTVAASNNGDRDHFNIACSGHLHISAILSAHPVRGVSRIQRTANREVATLSCIFVQTVLICQRILKMFLNTLITLLVNHFCIYLFGHSSSRQ